MICLYADLGDLPLQIQVAVILDLMSAGTCGANAGCVRAHVVPYPLSGV